jgi:replicative DNA helicase
MATRVPPHNINAEESLLGAMLLSRDAVNTASESGISVEHFYKPAHQQVFESVFSMRSVVWTSC